MSSFTFATAAANHKTNALIFGTQWLPATTVTYNFAGSASYYGSSYSPNNEPSGFNMAEAGLQNHVRTILNKQYAAVSNMTYNEVLPTAQADITVAKTTAEYSAHTYFPGSVAANGDVWFGRTFDYANAKIGSYEYRSIIHELGHANGLKHTHEASAYTSDVLSADRDSMEFSVMTYRSYVGGPLSYSNTTWSFSQTLMMYDIAALQQMYGANFVS